MGSTSPGRDWGNQDRGGGGGPTYHQEEREDMSSYLEDPHLRRLQRNLGQLFAT
jgi:hypothetical protein